MKLKYVANYKNTLSIIITNENYKPNPLKNSPFRNKKIMYTLIYRATNKEQKSISGFEIQWTKVHFTSQLSTSSVVIDLRNSELAAEWPLVCYMYTHTECPMQS